MKAIARQHGLSIAISAFTGLLVAVVVHGTGWAFGLLEEGRERAGVRTFLHEMEEDVFDHASLMRGVEGFKKAGMDPAPDRNSVQLAVSSGWLDSFGLLISVNATHLPPEERYKILKRISVTQNQVALLKNSSRSQSAESWYRVFLKMSGNKRNGSGSARKVRCRPNVYVGPMCYE